MHPRDITGTPRLAAIVNELPLPQRSELLNALSQVEAHVVHHWIATDQLQAWVQQGQRILTEKKARGEQFTAALFAGTAGVLPTLTQEEMGEWVRVGLDIEAVEGAESFTVLPDSLTALEVSERLQCYRLVRAAAYHSPQVAAEVYRALPRLLQTLPSPLRELLVRCLQPVAAFDPTPLPALLSFLGPTLRTLPAESRAALLERIAQLARLFPAGVVRLFRALARAYEEVGEEGVQAWIVAGEEIARRNPEAGEAFFALESRTSQRILQHASPAVSLSDVQGLLHKYVHMLSGALISIQETATLSFPPPLADGAEAALPLPASIAVFSTYEENLRLYRVLAAHQAGRMEFGTHAFSLSLFRSSLPQFVADLFGRHKTQEGNLHAYFHMFPQPERIEALFLFVEGQRIAARLATSYRGLQEDLTWAASLTHLLPSSLVNMFSPFPAPPRIDLGKDATVYDSVLAATELYTSVLGATPQPAAEARPAASSVESIAAGAATEDSAPMVFDIGDDEEIGEMQISAKTLAALQKHLATLRQGQGRKRGPRPLFLTASTNDQPASEDQDESGPQEKRIPQRRLRTDTGLRYLYDEWDYTIEDYRTHWCHLRELPLQGDSGAFFHRTLEAYAPLLPEIKREFQRLRPRQYRLIKGVEDGQEIDLDAAIAAHVDLRTGISPSAKLYAARQPLERDVAALFLLDMSASTDQLLDEQTGTRVIDVMKEALVLLSAALEDIGDPYALYGFSSHGRRNVEFYSLKTFAESLSAEVKGRMSAVAPKRSTRMGAAVRHAARKLTALSCRAKLLVLLSDGFPEDEDYGRGQHVPTYGLRDTMMALREAEKQGILSFCLTVDKGGHDYLREMCAPSRYLVIEDILSLPAELPKIYQRHIRSRLL